MVDRRGWRAEVLLAAPARGALNQRGECHASEALRPKTARPHTGLPARPLWLGGILMSLASTLVSKRGGSVSAAMNQDRVGTTRDPRAPILISGHAAKSTKKRQPAMNRDPARREISL